MERLRTSLRQPAIARRRHGATGVPEEAERLSEVVKMWRQDDCAHDDVRVAVHVFAKAVNYDIDALEERRCPVWGEEGVIDNNERV